ncbi:hypothetical protein OG523_06220 [Streptomyces virginiae]|uniref:hypothetical protein n=1 Tax=Streptomyces virginiae TaxID=1961 RepID=UPI002E37D79F|nr:hypothetical protein [Streptomyces virginiae]
MRIRIRIDAVDLPGPVPRTARTRPRPDLTRGILDGIAGAVTHGKDEGQARAWRTAVLNTLLNGQASPKSDQDPRAAHLTTAWLQSLKNASEEELFDRLRTQGVDMARRWAQERKLDEQTQQGLLAKVERSALSAYREVKP